MKIPEKVKIGGLMFDVSLKKNVLRDRSAYGQSCGNEQQIEIDESVSQQLKETTFIHEILHQIDFVYNIELGHQRIYQLEAGLYAFIKDNPGVFGDSDAQT